MTMRSEEWTLPDEKQRRSDSKYTGHSKLDLSLRSLHTDASKQDMMSVENSSEWRPKGASDLVETGSWTSSFIVGSKTCALT
jgi:hypothetical protein